MEAKNLTVMFTDIKGFTEMSAKNSRETVDSILKMKAGIVGMVVEKWHGRVIKSMGDGYLVVFDSPTNAVAAGLMIQSLVEKRNKAEGVEPFLLRIGISSGEVIVRDGDVFGDAVNVASRIESIAEPGEVYFTESVYLAMNKAEVPMGEVGLRQLKGVPEEVMVYKVLNNPNEKALWNKMRAAGMVGALRGAKDKMAETFGGVRRRWMQHLPYAVAFGLLLVLLVGFAPIDDVELEGGVLGAEDQLDGGEVATVSGAIDPSVLDSLLRIGFGDLMQAFKPRASGVVEATPESTPVVEEDKPADDGNNDGGGDGGDSEPPPDDGNQDDGGGDEDDEDDRGKGAKGRGVGNKIDEWWERWKDRGKDDD